MKKTISPKFNNITYPIFALRNKPVKLVFDTYTIRCVRNYNQKLELVDDKSLPGDYFNRLIQLDDRVMFDFTCKNLQELLLSKAAWGIDSNAVIHDLSKKVAVPVEQRLVTKISGNLVWLRNISYPFEIPTKENIRLDDNTYGILAYVNGEWFLREFSYIPNLVRPYIYV